MNLIVGHRGARGLWAENSLDGFRKTIALGVDCIELDVHLTTSGELVVIHDSNLERTTARSGMVEDLTPHQRQFLFLNGTREIVPTLEDVLEILRNSDVEIHVELKARADGSLYNGIASQVIDCLAARGTLSRAVLTSFSLEQLKRVKEANNTVRTLCSVSTKSAKIMGLKKTLRAALEVADIIAVEKKLLAKKWSSISSAVPKDKLGVWTVNSDEEIGYWMEQGLRQITTDRPDIAKSAEVKAQRHGLSKSVTGVYQLGIGRTLSRLREFALYELEFDRLLGMLEWQFRRPKWRMKY